MVKNPGPRARARVDIQENDSGTSELSADLASARARVRLTAESLIGPLFDAVYGHDSAQRSAKAGALARLLDKLQSGDLCAMDLDLLTDSWRDAWQLYRKSEVMCECRRPGRRGIPLPDGRHCMPCGEFHLCNACWDKHANCQQEAT